MSAGVSSVTHNSADATPAARVIGSLVPSEMITAVPSLSCPVTIRLTVLLMLTPAAIRAVSPRPMIFNGRAGEVNRGGSLLDLDVAARDRLGPEISFGPQACGELL